jgi:FkbM family methyltransferase
MMPKRAAPRPGQPTTYRGLHDMAGWWAWSDEIALRSAGTYRQIVKPGDLAFDIGANQGVKTWIMRHLGCKVIAVDPLFAFGNEFVPEFAWRFGNDPLVVSVPRAVSPERMVTLSINRFMPYVSSTDRRWMTESSHAPRHGQPYYQPGALIERRVPGITLDGLVGIYGIPAFIKIDVEGAECTAVATLSEPVAALNMEFHADWLPIAAMEHMDSMARYEWNYALDNRGGFVLSEWKPRPAILAHMRAHLTPEGPGSWGDVYGRRV